MVKGGPQTDAIADGYEYPAIFPCERDDKLLSFVGCEIGRGVLS